MFAVPAVTPVTTPVVLTVATAVLELLHTPPDMASERVVVLPVLTAVVHVMLPALASGLTVTAKVAVAVVHEFVTV